MAKYRLSKTGPQIDEILNGYEDLIAEGNKVWVLSYEDTLNAVKTAIQTNNIKVYNARDEEITSFVLSGAYDQTIFNNSNFNSTAESITIGSYLIARKYTESMIAGMVIDSYQNLATSEAGTLFLVCNTGLPSRYDCGNHIGKMKVLSFDPTAVHKTGSETITGEKLFLDKIWIQNEIRSNNNNFSFYTASGSASMSVVSPTHGGWRLGVTTAGPISDPNDLYIRKIAEDAGQGSSYLLFPKVGTEAEPKTLATTDDISTAAINNLAPAYDSSSTYTAGQKVIYNGQLYKCSTAIETAEAWNSAHWTAISVSSSFADLDDIPNNANIINGTGTNGIRQKMSGATVNFAGRNPHAEALDSTLTNTLNTGASGSQSAGFNKDTISMGSSTFTNGNKTVAKGDESHAEGYASVALGDGSHAEGNTTVSFGSRSHAEGNDTQAIGDDSHAEGHNTIAGNYVSSTKMGTAAHAEGVDTKIGSFTQPSGIGADQSGGGGGGGGGGGDTPTPTPPTGVAGEGSHAEGYSSIITGLGSHAEGLRNYLTGNYSHVQGANNTLSGNYATIMGYNNINSGDVSLVGGNWNNNAAYGSAIFGHHNKVQVLTSNNRDNNNKFVCGYYNDDNNMDLLEVGFGTADNNRKNVFAVLKDGTIQIPNFDSNDNIIGYAKIKCINGTLVVTTVNSN